MYSDYGHVVGSWGSEGEGGKSFTAGACGLRSVCSSIVKQTRMEILHSAVLLRHEVGLVAVSR